MRVVDLDRDMRDVIPTGTTRESEFLFERMTERTLALARPEPGRRILDVASGFGQDAVALAERGAWVVGAEPSARMAAFAKLESQKRSGPQPPRPTRPVWVRGWSDRLPFAGGSFDAVICKGAIDHFDSPRRAIAEMARVTRPRGRVVLAIANFESLACRVARGTDTLREQWLSRPPPRGRRHYDVPQDHFTRYDTELMREQASDALELELVEGISLAWGLPAWTRVVANLPGPVAQASLLALDRLARSIPSLADVVMLVGRPRDSAQRATTSA